MRNFLKRALNLYRRMNGAVEPRRISAMVENRLAVRAMEQNAVFKTESGVDPSSPLVASLTTYGKYIDQAHLAVESLLEQTCKPGRIILWVSDELRESEIPSALKNLRKRGLEIIPTRDIRSYKKLIPALKMFPENPIATFDDDIVYHPNALDILWRAHQAEPQKIHFRRGHKMALCGEREFAPYNSWKSEFEIDDCAVENLPTGVGGALFPPNSLDEEVFDESVFSKICPLADDVWFKAMALKAGTACHKVWAPSTEYYDIDIFGDESKNRLCGQNCGQNKNDAQIKAVWDHYNLWEKMK